MVIFKLQTLKRLFWALIGLGLFLLILATFGDKSKNMPENFWTWLLSVSLLGFVGYIVYKVYEPFHSLMKRNPISMYHFWKYGDKYKKQGTFIKKIKLYNFSNEFEYATEFYAKSLSGWSKIPGYLKWPDLKTYDGVTDVFPDNKILQIIERMIKAITTKFKINTSTVCPKCGTTIDTLEPTLPLNILLIFLFPILIFTLFFAKIPPQCPQCGYILVSDTINNK